jgi:hypothetical protein
VGLGWTVALLWLDIGGLGRLVAADPAALPVVLAGGTLAFLPAILPAAIGALAPPEPVRQRRGWRRPNPRNHRSR